MNEALRLQLDKIGKEITELIRDVALGNNPGPIVDRLLALKDTVNRLKAAA